MHAQTLCLPEALSGAVLAGGRGRRMGGVNKGLIAHNGRYLFEHAVNNLRPHICNLVIVTNTESRRYQSLGYEAIDDGRFRGYGPLAGIYAALSCAKTPFVAISPCDQGSLPEDVYSRLFDAARWSTAGAAVLGDEDNRYPTTAVLSVKLAASLLVSLQGGRLKLTQWYDEIGAYSLCYPGLVFHNFNTPQDLAVD